MKRLVVVRHGNTFEAGEEPRRIGARSDPPLTDEGRRQARRVGAWLEQEGIAVERALSGPLRRARATAGIVLETAGSSCRLAEAGWLDEVDYGPDEGRPESAVIARVGAAALACWDRHAVPAPGWPIDPTMQQRRVAAGVEALAVGTSLLVTSNGAARFIPLCLGIAGHLPSLKLRTGAIGIIVVADAAAAIERWDVRPD